MNLSNIALDILRICRRNHGEMAFLHVGAGLDTETDAALASLCVAGLVRLEDRPAPVSGSPGATIAHLTHSGWRFDEGRLAS